MKTFLLILFINSILVSIVNSLKTPEDSSSVHLDDEWWEPKYLQTSNDTQIMPFKISFKDEMIRDLRHRLNNHRPFTSPLEGVGFEYGFNTDYLDYWVNYWADSYNFSARETFLNQFPQYITNIQGLNIHFLWIKPKAPPNVVVLPLLYLHGWPGTVRELYESIPYLTSYNKTRNFVLEVIAPSLPGFGFSDAAVRPGLGVVEMAVVLRNLMRRLGFYKFYVQGGDWGSRVGDSIVTMYDKEVLGYHTNLAISRSPLSIGLWLAGQLDQSQVDPAVADRLYPLKDILGWLVTETGYFHLQATKPDSIGVAMADSPAGLLAYLLQLISSGTHKSNPYTKDGDLEKYYSRDGLLDILTIIWTSNSFTTSCRIYAESVNIRNYNSSLATKPTPVPTWTIHAKHEIFYQTPMMLKFRYPNLLHSTILDDGGHFLAFEKPKALADDVLEAIIAFRAWHDTKKNYKYEL